MIFSLEAERNVLGAIIVQPDCLLAVTEIISAADFYNVAHGRIYNACLDLYDMGDPIDILSVYHRLTNKEMPVDGGRDLISEIVSEHVTSANAVYHAKAIKEKALLRRLHSFGMEISSKAQEAETGDVISFATTGLNEISQQVAESYRPDAESIIGEIEQAEKGEIKYIPEQLFGNGVIESPIPGFFAGHLWVVGGASSFGKSTLLTQIVVDSCMAGARVVIFTTEDGRKQKIGRIIANLCEYPYKRLLMRQYAGKEREIKEAKTVISKWGLHVYDNIFNIDEIALKTKKHCIQGGCDIVAIDFVQNLNINMGIYEAMSYVAKTCQRIAIDRGVCLIALSQRNNESQKKDFDSSSMGLRGAGEIQEAADIVLLLNRKNNRDRSDNLEERRQVEVHLSKNRPFGVTGFIPMSFTQSWAGIRRR